MSPKALGHLLINDKISGSYTTADKDLVKSYDWMISQMRNRLGPEPHEGAYPMWVWYKWEGNKLNPPVYTLDYERMENPGGIYRLTLDIPDNLVLLSDFDAWHAVLNDAYLSRTEEELNNDKWTRDEIVQSWERIFDINEVDWNHLWGPIEKSIQGTVWEITTNMILNVEHFPHMKPTKKFLESKKFWDSVNGK